jgi:hypothetical protein
VRQHAIKPLDLATQFVGYATLNGDDRIPVRYSC